MKQSIALVILQIVNIVLGFVSVFWIAASIPAEVYAITAIYAVISSFLLVFSNTGLETYAIRNVLAWQQNQEYTKIKTVITQAVVLRTLLGAILVLPAIGYSFYISTHKFNGQHFSLFVTMSLISITVAYSDSVLLILKSFNRYFSAAFAVFVLRVIGRIVALMLFIKYGFEVYIHTVIFLPMIVAIPITIMLSKWINLKYLLTFGRKSKTFKGVYVFCLYILPVWLC